MKKVLLFLLFYVIFSNICLSQEKRITMIIDTLYSKIGFDNFHISYSAKCYNVPYMENAHDIELKTTSNNQKKYIGNINISNDASIVKVYFDDKASYFELSCLNSFTNNDTIKIDRINLCRNNLRDTTFTITRYFKKYNDSIGSKAYKVKKKYSIDKSIKDIHRKPNEIGMVINNKRIVIPLIMTNLTNVEQTNFMGQKPKNSRNPRIVFYGSSDKTSWNYIGKISFCEFTN